MSIGEDYIKIQKCVLRVGVHCDGCRRSLKNVLKEIQGVYIVSMDPGLGKVHVKVTMEAEMSPEVLMKRLKKKGKIDAELVTPQPSNGGAVESVLGGSNEGSGIDGGWDGTSGVQAPTTVAVGDGGISGSGGVATPPPQVAEDDDEEEDDELEPGGEEENEVDDDMLAENVAPPSNVSGGPQAPVNAISPKGNNNAGVNGDAPATLSGSGSRISGGVHPSTQPDGGQMATSADLAERMRAAMTAALGGAMGGGQNMGLYMAHFNSPNCQPPRPTSGPVNLHPDNSYQQQQHEQVTPPMSYQHPVPDELPTMEFKMPQQYSHNYPYADLQDPRHKEFSNDDFAHTFSDENTGSCRIM